MNAKFSSDEIKFRGLGTTGGVDGMMSHYWVSNMFSRGRGEFYCSEDRVDNIVVVAVLESCIAPREVDPA